MNINELTNTLLEAENLSTATRAERKVKRNLKIKLRRNFVGAHMRALNEAAKADARRARMKAHKATTMIPAKKAEKTFKAKHVPGIAHPVTKPAAPNQAWAAEKRERKAMKTLAIVGRKVNKTVPNKGMEDAQRDYQLALAYELIAAGDEQGWALLESVEGKTETVAPADVEPDLYRQEKVRIQRLEDAIKALPAEYDRLNSKAEKAEEKFTKAHKRLGIAKMMVTKATKAYDGTPERYERMMERKRHLESVQRLEKAAAEELSFRTRIIYEFADTWAHEEDRLNDLLENAKAKLETAKLARRHERRLEALEDVFSQRYERAEKVPEKTDADHYKVYSVKASKLHGTEVMHILDEMKALIEDKDGNTIKKDNRAPQWLVRGRALALQLISILDGKNEPFVVEAKDCIVNNVSRSQLSDIMGVEYGEKTPCKQILSVNYDLTKIFRIYWKFLAEKYEDSEKILHKIRVKVANRLVANGVVLKTGGNEVRYNMLASSPSQQKKGQAYMGEHETMKVVERHLEFGWTMEDAILNRPDNSAEWLKRNATLMTPSKRITIDGERGVKISKILMMKDVDTERYLDNVVTIDGGKLTPAERKLISMTMFDGQGLWLKQGRPTTQGRGTAMKVMIVALPDYVLPEYTTDIMGNKVRVADYDVLMTKSCWKASKMGMNWYQFRDTVTELAKTCPGYDELYSVRYSDREIGDEENPRNLARQATQQWVTMPDEDIEKLTRATRRWLKNNKKYRVLLAKLGEWDRPEEERSPIAKLFNRVPQLIVHPYIQQWLRSWWTTRRNKACSGRIRTNGMYPYIVQDPIAMIQILLEGRDPNAEDIGIVPAGMVNLPKVKTGREVYAIRYPANYMVGMVLTQFNAPEFRQLGNVAVLSARDDTIFRADGDFDGDEMLFIFDSLVIETMKRVIREYNPTLIDFPHSKVACDKPFGTREKFCEEIAEALVRAQEYNLVGTYSNLAVICLQQASIAPNALARSKWLNAAKVAHVGAIVCLDMVKGANVPKELLALLESLNKNVRENYSMPWNQQFSHPENDKISERSNSTQDKIAGLIYDDAGAFNVEFEEGDDVVTWGSSMVDLFSVCNPVTSFRRWVVDENAVTRLHGCHFEDSNDQDVWAKLENGKDVGLSEWLMLGWHNASSLLWKMSGADMVAKRNELNWFLREQIMDNIRRPWLREDGTEVSMSSKYATFLRDIVKATLGKNKVDEDKKGSFAMFMLRVFAEDILFAFDHDVVTDEQAIAMSAPRATEPEYIPSAIDDYDPEEIHEIMDDGSIYLSSDEEIEDLYVA